MSEYRLLFRLFWADRSECSSHGITEGVKDKDYFLAVDCPPPAIATVHMTPKEVI
jgi:hypothetical protein